MGYDSYLHRIIFVMSLVAATLTATACASLPEVRYLSSSLTASSSPTITNAQGNLNAKKSRSLLSKRWRNSHIDIAAMAALEEAATGTPLIAGNKITLLYDGPQTMTAMMEAINSAKDHINLETYIFDQDEVGIRFAELLMARQRAGVQVNIIYDSVGTIGTPQAFFDKMRDAGIRLLAFNPVNPLKLIGSWEPNNRDHRKILVVDGVVAFTGGVNISSTYANSSLFRSASRRNTKVGWRDTHIKIEGPAVAALQWTFLDTWTSEKSPDLSDSNFFPPLKEAGDKLVRVLASEPDGDQDIYKAYVLAIQEAKNTIHITCAYFVPDIQILQALNAAARRGVDVKIILPGVSDSSLVFHATQSFYDEMLTNGIKIYQLQIAVLHAKTAVIDKVWATVGSTNIDTRSFLHNNEINVVVFGEEFGVAMENAFTEDLRYSVEMTKSKWEQRPLTDRFKEWTARRLQYWL
ncbi:MAG: cardiolipin synthase [Undibacterium sp.]|uniref:cardiolipin synthase n=1 Tax=Undibacterium sp. TaxID=1914977 RepID=UPI002721A030|nr:cardiolipin synthase [Undibacterium sp.]MDO8654472.1 cardiolipin synthase [Undibacterium sp.]